MRKIKGQNITEFAIIVSLVVIVCIVILTLLGGQINKLFDLSWMKVENFKPFGVSYDKNTGKALTTGPLGGTPQQPVAKCNAGSCDIDYGDMVLTGIPENFGSFVESSGTSGGTEKLISLLEQIATDLENKGDSAGAQEFRDLANLSHFSAQMQRDIDQKAESCASTGNPMGCMQSYLVSQSAASSVPANISSLIPGFYTGEYLCNVSAFASLGYQRNGAEVRWPNSGYENRSTQNAASIKILDRILDAPDTKYSQNLKNITTALMQNIDNLAVRQQGMVSGIEAPHNFAANEFSKQYDIITGQPTGSITYTTPAQLEDLYHPSTAQGTDLTSILTCVAGKNFDSGRACK